MKCDVGIRKESCAMSVLTSGTTCCKRFYEHNEGFDGVVSSTKVKAVVPFGMDWRVLSSLTDVFLFFTAAQRECIPPDTKIIPEIGRRPSARSLRHLVTVLDVCTFLAELFPIRRRGSCAFPQEGRVSLATWPIPRTPQVMGPRSSTRLLPQTETRRPSTIRTTITSLTSQKITRENTGLFGVSTMLEASVSHVSPGESNDSMHRETVAKQRRQRRFCGQCCRVDVKEKSTEQ